MNNTQSYQSGFSLIETIIALLILTVSMTALYKTQSELMMGTMFAHAYSERILAMKNYFVTADQNKWFNKQEPQKKELEEPSMTLTYKTEKPKNAQLQPLAYLVMEKVSGSWPSATTDIEEQIVSCVMQTTFLQTKKS
jgi:prepilin-type N-terminal cleavage/methylation domain-containing protein